MDINQTLARIGSDNYDFLLCNDAWLESEYKLKTAKLDNIISELRAIENARKLKRYLQQTNQVIVQRLIRDNDGSVSDISLDIMDLPSAACALEDTVDVIGTINAVSQYKTWQDDGYDVKLSRSLRD